MTPTGRRFLYMKIQHLLIALLALVVQDAPAEGKRWWSHVEFLASDGLEGRNVGTPGFEKAVAYVEGEFKKIGLRPGGTDGFRQAVPLEVRVLIPEKASLALVRNGTEAPLALREDATLNARGDLNGTLEAGMVFVGYGLTIPEAQWDDLAGLDLRGKIAVYVNTAPPAEMTDNVRSHVTSAGERWAVLKKAGAVGIATIPGPAASSTPAPEPTSTAAPGSKPAPPADPAGRPPAPVPPPPLYVLADADLQDHAGQVVSMTFTRRGAEKLLSGTGHTLAELHALIADKKPLPRFGLDGVLRVQTTVQRDQFQSSNVVGIHEGSDPKLKDEYIVMSAHLDHVGLGRAIDGDSLYNGAMDDASGVASVIEMARLLKESNAKPKRSIVFIAVTAEEKGLLGSKYFAGRPTVAFDKIVANINLDMFLPLYPLKVIEVQGLAESSLGDSVRAAAKELGVDVQTDREPDQNRFIRSDQYSFIRRGIPSLAFKFGYEFGSAEEKIRRDWVRDVYHKPNDDLKQPVDLEAAARFNRVILGLLQRVANDDGRPRWNDASFFKRFAAAR